MYCENCGTKLDENALFCSNCGHSIKGEVNVQKESEKVVDDEVQLKVKPTFKFVYLFSSYIILFLMLSLMLCPVFILSIKTLTTAIISVIAIMFVIMSIVMLFTKKQYDSYNYDFYKTKIIYSDSFINISEKEVKYKHIREVYLRRGFFQRWFNLGTIMLYTNAETGYVSGIQIRDVENSEQIYKQIKQLIND